MSELPKALPIGIQSFAKIRSENCLYVDKTDLAVDLIKRYSCVFLSRPRRFGKSLLVDTLAHLFSGEQKLFQGLAAEKKHDWSKRHPVIRFSFGIGEFRNQADLKESIADQLTENEERLGITNNQARLNSSRFSLLIRKSFEKYGEQAVILVDEYDKPILDNIDNLEMAQIAREELKALYSVIKDSDSFIRFTFLTGVSKFSKVSIFSGLNNLKDISLSSDFGTICGYSHQELETVFIDHLKDVDMSELQNWYNGYNFLGENVYNPYDILLFIDNHKEFSSYWFETGTPTFLVKLIKEKRFFLPELSGFKAGAELLNSFDIENIKPIPLLFQAGYLTIKKVQKRGNFRIYHLDFPNLEVSSAFNNSLLEIFTTEEQRQERQMHIYFSLLNCELDNFREEIYTLFAAIPYHHYSRNDIAEYEGFYASVIYAWLASSQLPIIMEDCTNKGRIDLTVILDKTVYIIEFKVDQKGSALAQIKERNYAEKYMDNSRSIYLVGITFNSDERNVSEFIWEKI